MPAVLSILRGADADPAKTRSGTAYSRAPRPIVCSPSFSLAECLQTAIENENSTAPDIDQVFAPKRAWEDAGGGASDPPPFERAFNIDSTPTAHACQMPTLSPGSALTLPSARRISYHYNIRAGRDKARKNAKRARQRDEDFLRNTRPSRPDVVQEHVQPSAAFPVAVALEELPANSSGYESLASDSGERKHLDYDVLVADGFRTVEWDGKESLAFVDADSQRVFAACVGMPDDPSYADACRAAGEFILKVGEGERFSKKELEHKRGDGFGVVNIGILYGHGPPKPYNLLNSKHKGAADALLANNNIRRLALFQSAALKLYAPKLYNYYHSHTVPLRQHMPHLHPNWEWSVFSAAAFNFGPRVVTYPHRDCMNLAYGLCAIHAFGNYDHTKGGHLVLKEARLIIQFPPGGLILVPSATITHGNTPIQDGEVRTSFTQYSAGAMFRYVDSGFKTQEQLRLSDSAAYEKMLSAKANRWRQGLELWSTVDEILEKAGVGPEEGEVSE